MTRLLGVDLGERRIGLATAEPGREPACPLTTVRRGGDAEADAARLVRIVEAHRIDELVVGLPLESSGVEGPMAAAARAWAERVAAVLGIQTTLRDERLSSHLAERRLGPMPRGRGGGPPSKTQRDRYRAAVDREAAAVILEDEVAARIAEAATPAAATTAPGPARAAGPAATAPGSRLAGGDQAREPRP